MTPNRKRETTVDAGLKALLEKTLTGTRGKTGATDDEIEKLVALSTERARQTGIDMSKGRFDSVKVVGAVNAQQSIVHLHKGKHVDAAPFTGSAGRATTWLQQTFAAIDRRHRKMPGVRIDPGERPHFDPGKNEIVLPGEPLRDLPPGQRQLLYAFALHELAESDLTDLGTRKVYQDRVAQFGEAAHNVGNCINDSWIDSVFTLRYPGYGPAVRAALKGNYETLKRNLQARALDGYDPEPWMLALCYRYVGHAVPTWADLLREVPMLKPLAARLPPDIMAPWPEATLTRIDQGRDEVERRFAAFIDAMVMPPAPPNGEGEGEGEGQGKGQGKGKGKGESEGEGEGEGRGEGRGEGQQSDGEADEGEGGEGDGEETTVDGKAKPTSPPKAPSNTSTINAEGMTAEERAELLKQQDGTTVRMGQVPRHLDQDMADKLADVFRALPETHADARVRDLTSVQSGHEKAIGEQRFARDVTYGGRALGRLLAQGLRDLKVEPSRQNYRRRRHGNFDQRLSAAAVAGDTQVMERTQRLPGGEPPSVLVAVDVSGSMGSDLMTGHVVTALNKGEAHENRQYAAHSSVLATVGPMAQARQAVEAWLGGANEAGCPTSLVLWDDAVYVAKGWDTPWPRTGASGLASRLCANGGTALQSAFITAAKMAMASPTRQTIMVFITDGSSHNYLGGVPEAAAYAEKHGVHIVTVGLGVTKHAEVMKVLPNVYSIDPFRGLGGHDPDHFHYTGLAKPVVQDMLAHLRATVQRRD